MGSSRYVANSLVAASTNIQVTRSLPLSPRSIFTQLSDRSYAISYLLKLNAIWRLLQLGQIRSGIGSPGLELCIMSMVRSVLLSSSAAMFNSLSS